MWLIAANLGLLLSIALAQYQFTESSPQATIAALTSVKAASVRTLYNRASRLGWFGGG